MFRLKSNKTKDFVYIITKTCGNSLLLSEPLPRFLRNRPRKTLFEYLHIKTSNSCKARLELVKWLVKFCANQYMIDLPKIKVKFSDLQTNEAAHVFTKGGVWYIEVDSYYKWSDLYLTAIIAHEMGHVYLGLKNVNLQPTVRNEELTDTVAILAGFGEILRAASSRKKIHPILLLLGAILVTHRELGYLSKSEINALSKTKKFISTGHPIKRWTAIDLEYLDTVNCYACTKILRLPKHSGKFIISCPACQMKQSIVLQNGKSTKETLVQESIKYFQRMADYFQGFDDF